MLADHKARMPEVRVARVGRSAWGTHCGPANPCRILKTYSSAGDWAGPTQMMIEACGPRASPSLLRQDPTSLPVKFWSVFSYLIVYDPAARPIAIVRALDGRRDARAILDREAQH